MLTAAYILGWCFGGISFTMMIPAIYALTVGEQSQAMAFMNSAVALFFVSGGLIFALHRDTLPIGRREQLLIVLGLWGVLPLGAAMPYYLTGVISTYPRAYFEAMSGFTTTGLSVFEQISELPKSVIMWRALLQWLGGLTTLLSLSFIVGRVIGADLFGRDTSSIIQSNSGTARDLENTFVTIMPLYFGMTLACYLLLMISGIPSFDATCLSLVTLSTGGYMPRDGAISLYGSPAAELTLAVFMFFGAVSVVWVKALMEWNKIILKRTFEPVWISLTILVLGLVLAIGILRQSPQSDLFSIVHSFTLGLASAASVVTTTGLVIGNSDQVHLPYLLLLPLALIGGGRYSTAGGLKFNRVLTMLDLSLRELRKLLYPHGVGRTLYGSEARDRHVGNSVWNIFAVTIMSMVVMMLLLSYVEVPLTGALMATVGTFSNFGPIYDMVRVTSPDVFPPIGQLGHKAHLMLCVGMIIGRVESIVLLGFLNFAVWRK